VTVYVDDWRQAAQVGPIRDRWSHLLADDQDELHQFAARLGLRRTAFQRHRHPAGNHYDVTDRLRLEAIALGAVAITWREAGRMLRAAKRGAGGTDGWPPRPDQPKVSGPASPPGAASARRSR